MSIDSRNTALARDGKRSLAGRSEARRVLVTGASGFLGRAVVERLVVDGWRVDAVTSGAVTPDESRAAVDWHRADLLDPTDAQRLLSRLEVSHLVHLAWAPNRGVYASPENFLWVVASLRLLEAFLENGGRRAVFAGSSAEYDWSSGVCRERGTPLAGGGAYGAAKRALAELFQGVCGLRGPSADAGARVSGAWARIFFLFGPHEPETRLVADVARALIQGAPVRCSEGAQVRDYLFVEDAADALVQVLLSNLSGPINIGSGEGIRVRDLVLDLADAVGTDRDALIEWGKGGQAGPEAPLVIADVGRLRDELGWRPGIGVSEGLHRTVDWWRRRLTARVVAGS